MKIFVVNGAPCAGKTTFEENIKKMTRYRNCYILSTITPIKEIAKMVGWDGTKDQKNRKFLSDLKDLLTEYNDFSFKYIKEEIDLIKNQWWEFGLTNDNAVVFIDCREPEEIKRLCDELGAKSLLIRRASAENSATSNHADSEVLNYDYDIILENNGDLRDFAEKAFEFMKVEELPTLPNLTINLFGEIVPE